VIAVQTNHASFIEQLNWHSNQSTAALKRLSSGSKLLAPQDDAAGLAVATRMEAQLLQLNATSNNVSNAVSFTQTQSGYLAGAQKILDRMGELAIRAQDGTNSDEIRALYNQEFQALKDTFNDARTARYNEVDLFDGQTLAVAISPENGNIDIGGVDLFTAEMNALTANSTQLNTLANAGSALDSVLEASNQLTQNRASLGSTLSELETASSQIATNRASTSATLSQIRDANVADEITNFTREQILTQTSVFALQQANSQRANVLNLLS
jgi:flagellin